jgi:hypothetical protein
MRHVRVDRLRRISGHDSGEPYFGRHGVYRFDDPKKTYGTSYCGLDLDTAVAESLLHDELPNQGMFDISESLLELKFLVKFAPAAANGVLTLADLTGASLKRLGGDNSISSEFPYDITQLWSAAVHAHPSDVDGIIYVSRQLNNKRAVAIYDRAAPKFGQATYTRLASVPGFKLTRSRLGIRALYP